LSIKKGSPVNIAGLSLMLTDITTASYLEEMPLYKQLPLVFLLPLSLPTNLLTMWTLRTSINQLIKHSFWSTLPWFPGVPNFPTGPGRPFSPFSPKGPGGPGGPTAEIPGSPFCPIRDYSSLNVSVLIPLTAVYTNTHDSSSLIYTLALHGKSRNNCVGCFMKKKRQIMYSIGSKFVINWDH
jgi:hypothetical protein